MISNRIMYLREESGQPMGCVSIEMDSFNETNKFYYQLSVAHSKDKFDKTIARKISFGRLATSPIPIEVSHTVNMHTISSAVMESIAKDSKAPNRARKAALRWLKTSHERFDHGKQTV